MDTTQNIYIPTTATATTTTTTTATITNVPKEDFIVRKITWVKFETIGETVVSEHHPIYANLL
jgi:hypothetical protein